MTLPAAPQLHPALGVSHAPPVSAPEFAAAMRALEWRGSVLALAVSGGPDSMALALCAQGWAVEQGVNLIAFTIDHALRAESAVEANQVQRWVQARGIEHHVLRWEHPPVTRALQQQARAARYRLLAEACVARGIAALALAHQQEDQAETVLLRFAKGSGVDGLAAMRPVGMFEGLRLLRPFLAVPKARLIATCDAAGQSYVTDPSNSKQAFARGRLRAVSGALAAEGLTPARLGDLAARAALASDALQFYAARALGQCVLWHASGYAEINLTLLADEPAEIRQRVLRLVLGQIGGGVPLRYAAMQELDAALRQPHVSQRTLHGCAIRAFDGVCRVVREAAAVIDQAAIAPGESRVWDGRFRVTLAAQAPEGLTLGKLGILPHEQLDSCAPGLRHAVPLGQVRATLPALWRGDALYAVAGYGKGAGLLHYSLLPPPVENE